MIKLDVKKIEKERSRLELSKADLARKMGISRQLLYFTMKESQLFHIDKFADVFDIEPKDLII